MNGKLGISIQRRWVAGLAALCALLGATPPFLAAEPGTEENRVAIEKWIYSRERKTINSSNRVIANFSVKNVTGKLLEGVSVEVTLFSGLGEKVAGPIRHDLGTIKPQGAAGAQVSANMVPAFGAYEIAVSYKGGKEFWYSNSDMANPQPKPKGLTQNTAKVVVAGQEVGPDKSNQLSGQVRVRNEGAMEAKDVKLQVIYWGAEKAGKRVKIGEWSGPLGNGKIPPGKELTFPVKVPGRVPVGMNTFEIRATCSEAALEAQISGGEFANGKELESAHWQFKRVGDKQQDLEVVCDVRNGFSSDVRDVRINLEFVSTENGKRTKVKSYAHAMSAPLKSGEVARAMFTVKDLAKYDGYECSFEFGAAEAQTAVKKPVAPQYQNKATVEVLFKDVTTADDGTVMVVCSARNGLPHQVKDVGVTFRLLKQDGSVLKQAEKKLEDPLLPGEEASFVVRIPDGKGFTGYDSQVTFLQNKNGGTSPVAQADGAVQAKAPEPTTVVQPVQGPEPEKVPPPASKKQASKTGASAQSGPVDLP